MSQQFGIATVGPRTPALMYPDIMNSLNALKSGHLGAARPAYAEHGTFWAKSVNSTTTEIYFYDGNSDILWGTFNPTTHVLTATALADNQVPLGKLAQISTSRLLGRATAGAGDVESLTPAQVTAMLNPFQGDSGAGGIQGLVPPPAAGEGAAGYVLFADGTWGLPSSGMPPAVVAWTAAAAAPSGWLLSYGQTISRSTYAALFAAIGTTFGVGNGSTTFGLPDLRGRVIAGQDDMGGASANRLTNQSGGVDGDTLGATGGEEGHQLTAGENGPHIHSISQFTSGSGGGSMAFVNSAQNGGLAAVKNTNSSGTGDAHNNVQPTIILNGIIKI